MRSNQALVLSFLRSAAPLLVQGKVPTSSGGSASSGRRRKRRAAEEEEGDSDRDGAEDDTDSVRGCVLLVLRQGKPYDLWDIGYALAFSLYTHADWNGNGTEPSQNKDPKSPNPSSCPASNQPISRPTSKSAQASLSPHPTQATHTDAPLGSTSLSRRAKTRTPSTPRKTARRRPANEVIKSSRGCGCLVSKTAPPTKIAVTVNELDASCIIQLALKTAVPRQQKMKSMHPLAPR